MTVLSGLVPILATPFRGDGSLDRATTAEPATGQRSVTVRQPCSPTPLPHLQR